MIHSSGCAWELHQCSLSIGLLGWSVRHRKFYIFRNILELRFFPLVPSTSFTIITDAQLSGVTDSFVYGSILEVRLGLLIFFPIIYALAACYTRLSGAEQRAQTPCRALSPCIYLMLHFSLTTVCPKIPGSCWRELFMYSKWGIGKY